MNLLEPLTFIRKHLTEFARLLARHRPRGGLYDHKWTVTLSSERANPAFGAPEQPTSGVSQLARCRPPQTLSGAALTAWLDELFRGIKCFRIIVKGSIVSSR